MDLTEKQEKVIETTKLYVQNELADAESGHDWWHVYRVWKIAVHIAKQEFASQYIVQLGALLHDIADPKFHDGDEEIGPAIAEEFLVKQEIEQAVIDEVIHIIKHISFKNSFELQGKSSLEFKVVQDADRIDAMGAIGIARAFNYGGFKNRMIYDPEQKPNIYHSKEAYKKSDSNTINHFYEKLFLLKDMMNTQFGKQIAHERHEFMETYLNRFFHEWDGLK
jgi:uncharacterized protein